MNDSSSLLLLYTISPYSNSSREHAFAFFRLSSNLHRPPYANVCNAAIERPFCTMCFYILYWHGCINGKLVFRVCACVCVCVCVHVYVCLCMWLILNPLECFVSTLHTLRIYLQNVIAKEKKESKVNMWNEKWCQKNPGYKVLAFEKCFLSRFLMVVKDTLYTSLCL